MRLVAAPSFVRRRAVVYGTLTLAALLMLLVLGIWSHFHPSLLAMGGMLACLAVVKETLPFTYRYVSGLQGEQHILKQLQALPDEYIALTNFVVPGSQRGDIDILLLGRMGVWVIEVKTYSGHIRYEQGRWWKVQANGWKTRLKSVSGQAKGNARDLEAYLKAQGRLCRVQSVLVFVGAERLEVDELKMPVVRAKELVTFVSQLPQRLPQQEVEQLALLLSPACSEARTTHRENAG